jgi:hypothetical protein
MNVQSISNEGKKIGIGTWFMESDRELGEEHPTYGPVRLMRDGREIDLLLLLLFGLRDLAFQLP